MSENIRALAARLIGSLSQQKGSLKSLLPGAQSRLDERDRPLLQQICYGTLRDLPRLQALADHLLRRPFRDDDSDLNALLLVGLYQLRSLRMPEHAAVNETVNACQTLGKEWARKLFNGVLRNYLRHADSIEEELAENPQFQWNHPQWMIDKLSHNWPEQWQQILGANDEQAPMTLRVNPNVHAALDSAIAALDEDGIGAHKGQICESALILEQAVPVEAILGFESGAFSVQDQAAQLAATLLDCQAGDHVLDACAAPGGKLGHLLEHSQDLGEVVALELDEGRVGRINENLERLAPSLASSDYKVVVGDAAAAEWWDGKPFSRILADVPCSGTGVIRRNPDIKLLRREGDIKGLAEQQLEILKNLWSMLAPGGRLVYATCSVFPQENERIIERFVKLQPEARHLPIEAQWGVERPFGRQLFPDAAEHDGFFYAILEKPAVA